MTLLNLYGNPIWRFTGALAAAKASQRAGAAAAETKPGTARWTSGDETGVGVASQCKVSIFCLTRPARFPATF
jgi:hypothetical protein